jgi:hypothetical protein
VLRCFVPSPPASSTRFRDRLRNCVVQHVPNAREQPQDAVLNLRVESAGLLDIDDTILRAR